MTSSTGEPQYGKTSSTSERPYVIVPTPEK